MIVKEIERASSQKSSIGYCEVFFRKNYLRFSFRKCSTILLCHSAKTTEHVMFCLPSFLLRKLVLQ